MYLLKKALALLVISTLLALSGCATNNGQRGVNLDPRSKSLPQCIVSGAFFGAVLTEIGNYYFGVRGSDHRQQHRAEGAVTGAALGAAACWNNDTQRVEYVQNVHSTQTAFGGIISQSDMSRIGRHCRDHVSNGQAYRACAQMVLVAPDVYH